MQQQLVVEGLDEEKNILGSGAYGVVYRVTVDGRECVAKKLHDILCRPDGYYGNRDPTTQQRDYIIAKFLDECQILSTLNHPNVVGFVGVHFGDDNNDISLLMERLHIDLDAYVKQNHDTTLSQRILILLDVSKGLLYLHSLTPTPLVHRDLTAFNILLTEDLTAKIADLGVSRYIDPSIARMIGLTVNPGHQIYMPPESRLRDPVYSTKLDIFSFGNLILHTINGMLPRVHDLPLPRQQVLDPDGRVELMRRDVSVHEQMGDNHCLYPLAVHCLHDRPEGRPTIKEVYRSLGVSHEKHVSVYSSLWAYTHVKGEVTSVVYGYSVIFIFFVQKLIIKRLEVLSCPTPPPLLSHH